MIQLRALRGIATLTMLALGGCGSDGEVVAPTTQAQLYQEDFEGYTSGTEADKGGWSLRGVGASALEQVISDEQAHAGQRSLRLLNGVSKEATVEREVGELGEAFYLEGYVMAGTNGGAFIGIEGIEGAADGAAPLLIAVGVNAQGFVEAKLGSKLYTTDMSVSPMFWLGLKLKLWLLMDLYGIEFTVDDVKAKLDITPAELRLLVRTLRYKLVCSATGNGSRAFFDDLKVGSLVP